MIRQTFSSGMICYDEQDFSPIHTEALNALLVVIEPVVKNFDLARIILKSPCCGRKADTVLREIRCRPGFVPFIFHVLDTTGYQYCSSNGMRQKAGFGHSCVGEGDTAQFWVQQRTLAYAGAPQSMKMGNAHSLRRYAGGASVAIQPINLRRSAIPHYAF